jgi:DNA recombination-dependent growth factor C
MQIPVSEGISVGLLYGSGSFTRFVVEGPLPQDYLEEFPKRISRFSFRTIDEASDQERSTGWVNALDIFDSRFAAMEYLKEPCIVLSWRVDVRKVPAKALKQSCREAEEKIRVSEKVEFLSKKRRREIMEGVQAALMRRAIPSSQAYDMIWNLQTGLVIFGAVSNKVCDEFSEFFLQCFGLHLKTLFPYSAATRLLEKEGKDPTLLENLRNSLTQAG